MKTSPRLTHYITLLSACAALLCADPGWAAAARQTAPLTPEPQALALQESFRKVAAAVKPAVVSITTMHTEAVDVYPYPFFFGDPFDEFFGQEGHPRQMKRKYEGLGSGVVIDARGYILTNEHVVHDADQIKVTIRDPEEKVYKGKVVGKDLSTDLAVVKIEPKHALIYARLGDSDKVEVGDWAMAIGSPFGLEQTVTVGVISALRQSLEVEDRVYSNFFQTDAAINRGNSGGPLVNIQGEVIGINTAIYGPTGVFAGIGFAIPSNQAKRIMEQLIEKGRVVRSWIGVEITPLDEVSAREFNIPNTNGALVNSVVKGSPADKAGIQRGDVILLFNGESVTDPQSLIQSVTKTPPKTTVTVRVIRAGRTQDLALVTAERPAQPSENEEARPEQEPQAKPEQWQGAVLRTATPRLNPHLGLPADAKGVVVVGVEPGSAAEEMGLQSGDLIAAINRKQTPDLAVFLKAAKGADLRRGVLLDVDRGGQQIYITFSSGR